MYWENTIFQAFLSAFSYALTGRFSLQPDTVSNISFAASGDLWPNFHCPDGQGTINITGCFDWDLHVSGEEMAVTIASGANLARGMRVYGGGQVTVSGYLGGYGLQAPNNILNGDPWMARILEGAHIEGPVTGIMVLEISGGTITKTLQRDSYGDYNQYDGFVVSSQGAHMTGGEVILNLPDDYNENATAFSGYLKMEGGRITLNGGSPDEPRSVENNGTIHYPEYNGFRGILEMSGGSITVNGGGIAQLTGLHSNIQNDETVPIASNISGGSITVNGKDAETVAYGIRTYGPSTIQGYSDAVVTGGRIDSTGYAVYAEGVWSHVVFLTGTIHSGDLKNAREYETITEQRPVPYERARQAAQDAAYAQLLEALPLGAVADQTKLTYVISAQKATVSANLVVRTKRNIAKTVIY